MDLRAKNYLDNRLPRQEEVIGQVIQDATIQWGLARLEELEQRFDITEPPLVARALGISVPLAMLLVKISKASGGKRS